MKTFLYLPLFCLQLVVVNTVKSEGVQENNQISDTNMSNFFERVVQKLSCEEGQSDFNSRVMFQTGNVVQAVVETVLTYGQLKGWEYVIDPDLEYVQVPKFLLDSELKDFPYLQINMYDDDNGNGNSTQITYDNGSSETFSIHELAADFVTTVVTALQTAFQKLDKKIDFSPSKESLEKIITDIESSLKQGDFDSESFMFDFTTSQEFLNQIAQILQNKATSVPCEN